MKRSIQLAAVTGIAISMGIQGCNGIGPKTVEIDGHMFRVPREYLVKGTIPWLPTSQSDGLQFLVNPEDRSKEHLIVTIESTAATCHPAIAPASSQLASTCKSATQKRGNALAEQGFALQKFYRNGDSTQWEYRSTHQGGSDQGAVIASCYALTNDGGAGLCTSLGDYKDLVYSVGLRDSDVKRLPAIRIKIHEMLSSWESR